METFYVASGVGCATEEETAARSVQLGLKPVPSGESWTRAEAVEATEKLAFNLVTSRRNIHEASPGKVVQGPQSLEPPYRGFSSPSVSVHQACCR